MSVLIKGMPIPEGCRVCPFAERIPPGRTRCMITCRLLAENYNPPSLDRPDWCPLAELPDKHGRLIDENDVIDAIHDRLHELQTHKEFTKKHGDIDLLGVMPYIAKVQSVIEAEGEQ